MEKRIEMEKEDSGWISIKAPEEKPVQKRVIRNVPGRSAEIRGTTAKEERRSAGSKPSNIPARKEGKKQKWLLAASRNLFFLAAILLILNIIKVLDPQKINQNYLVILLFFFGFSWLFFFVKKDEAKYKERLESPLKYLFLILLFLIAVTALQFNFLTDLSWFKYLAEAVKAKQLYLTLFAIGSGFFTFWFNREKIEEREKEQSKEEIKEKQRRAEFSKKHQRLNKIPIVRNIAKWMYKEGWVYGVGIVAITLTGLIMRLAKADFWPFFR
ncbi:MAG: hypothetical protein V1659_04705, partial [Candidatus Woesearchaeota archaeon]